MTFKVGDVVKISALGKRYYPNDSRGEFSNPHNSTGVVSRVYGTREWNYSVNWHSGGENDYREGDLELASIELENK